MTIQRGDYVRPNNPSVGLPQDSVWRVVCSAGGLKLDPENGIAQRLFRSAIVGCRFPAWDFDKVVLCRGQWVAVNDADFLREPFGLSAFDIRPTTGRISSYGPSLSPELQNLPRTQTSAVVKAKADKEAAAKAKAEEAKRQLAVRLHADHCLGEATLALIAEVSRLNSGGPEQVAHSSIANHVGQLQALAKSYGYRIAKPSMLAQVIKL